MIDVPNAAKTGDGVTTLGVADEALADGFEALARGDWKEAEDDFRAALTKQGSPEAWEGLGLALWWRNDVDGTFEARERAYSLYRVRGDRCAASRVAIWLAWDYLGIRGQMAVANGWLQRAHSLVDDLELCGEQGWLALREAENAILWAADPATSLALAKRGVEIGRTLGSIDLEMYGRALEGFALVSQGDVADGMRRLDEAATAAISGEMRNRTAIGSTCCCVIFACERVYDYDRALEWCERLKRYCERLSYVPLLGVCRSHYAGILMWAGEWNQAEAELDAATSALRATRPAFLAEAIARQGSLRLQQGRLDEAVSLFEQVLHFPPAHLGLGNLALDLGEAGTALDHAERYLRQIPLENRTERVAGLDLIARAHLALGHLNAAEAACDELTAIAGAIATGPLLAIANLVAGLVAIATHDHERARTLLEDAVDLFGCSGARYEMGRARIALAQSLEALGRLAAAEREAHAAVRSLHELGAERQAARAEALLRHLQRSLTVESEATQGTPKRLLSPRQEDVLRLIAGGLSDQEIARQLKLSHHTIHRHVTNILTRLGVPSRSAAVAYAAREGLLSPSDSTDR